LAAGIASVLAMLAQGSEATSLAEIIGSGAQRISDIVAAMRSYSYLDRGVVQIVDVTEGIESTLVLLQSQLRRMKVVREYAEDLPQIAVRGTELNQVWTNIIANAVDATEGTGTLTVRTELSGDRVAVEFEDDGPGMGPGVADRVFDPFFTTKPPGKGTGLGLNISYNIVVRQHGGEISVVSDPGRTVFRVVLSQTGAVAAAGEGASSVPDAVLPDA
jgi:signal transduction histidine kinase